MTDVAATPVFVRARLRRDSSTAALARLLIPESAGARLGAAHSLVWALFADEPDRSRDFLWREMRPGEFLILSLRPPADPHGLFDLECKPFAPALRSGQQLRFDLRANPVIAVAEKPGERGKRRDIVMHAIYDVAHEERAAARETAIRELGTAWLARKGETAGFGVAPDRLYIDDYDQVHIPREGTRSIVFSTLTFHGVLTVHDPARFLTSIAKGFGAAKAFGCGLMLIGLAYL